MRRAGKTIGWERAGRCRTPPVRSTGPEFRPGCSRTASFGEEQVVRAGSERAAPGGAAAAGGAARRWRAAAVASAAAAGAATPEAQPPWNAPQPLEPRSGSQPVIGVTSRSGVHRRNGTPSSPATPDSRSGAPPTPGRSLPPSAGLRSSPGTSAPPKPGHSSAATADVRRNPGRLVSDHQAQRRGHARRGPPCADPGQSPPVLLTAKPDRAASPSGVAGKPEPYRNGRPGPRLLAGAVASRAGVRLHLAGASGRDGGSRGPVRPQSAHRFQGDVVAGAVRGSAHCSGLAGS